MGGGRAEEDGVWWRKMLGRRKRRRDVKRTRGRESRGVRSKRRGRGVRGLCRFRRCSRRNGLFLCSFAFADFVVSFVHRVHRCSSPNVVFIVVINVIVGQLGRLGSRDVGENFVLGRTNLKLVRRPWESDKIF